VSLVDTGSGVVVELGKIALSLTMENLVRELNDVTEMILTKEILVLVLVRGLPRGGVGLRPDLGADFKRSGPPTITINEMIGSNDGYVVGVLYFFFPGC